MCASCEASKKSALHVHDKCARVSHFYTCMHAQLSSRKLCLIFLLRCPRSEGSGESALLARAISYNVHETGELANENLLLITYASRGCDISGRAFTSAQFPQSTLCYIHKALKYIKAQWPFRIKTSYRLRIKKVRSLIILRKHHLRIKKARSLVTFGKHHPIDFNRPRVKKTQSPFILRIAD